MLKNQMGKWVLHFMILVSFFGVLLIMVIALLPPKIPDDFQWRKQSTGLIFISICTLGMISVFFPRRCSKIFHEDVKTENSDTPVHEKVGFQKSSKILGIVLTHGHHPLCRGFSHHEFKVGKKTCCTACMGLFFGAVTAIFGALSYFFFESSVGLDALPLVVFGIIGVALCLVHYMSFDSQSGLKRFSINAFFIIGMLLITVGIDYKIQSLTLNFFIISLFIFWLFTRILLSRRNHEKICRTCNLDCNRKNR